jgi:2'-hydroxyisoflavone reductase
VRILVLGGTRFAGRAIVEAALGRGDTVTMFNRGITNRGLFPGVETVIGDRAEDLSPLGQREFDAVIDVACYDPAAARVSAGALEGRAGRYVFVSTVSVYADQSTTEAQLEDAPLAELKPDVADPLENYGANKALCEAVIREAFGERALIARPGLISGPHDPTDRFPYWPRRIARGGRVLAPGDAGDLTQVLDVRDLAAFLLDGVHRDRRGVYNLTGNPRPFGILLDLCRTATYSDAELTWVDSDRLVAAGVDPGAGIPMWVAGPGYEAFNDVDSSHAVGAGLNCRAITETIRDTLAWDLARGGPEKQGLDPPRRSACSPSWRASRGRWSRPRARAALLACRNHPAQKQRLASRSGNGRWSAARARPGDDALLLVEAEGELVRGHAHELAERGSHRITLIPGDVVALGPRRPSRSPSATM